MNYSQIFDKVVDFIRKNSSLGYSFLLVVAIPAALFAFSFHSISVFEKNFNHLLQTKALLAENIFTAFIKDELEKPGEEKKMEQVQQAIEEILLQNPDVSEMKVLAFDADKKQYQIIASSKKDEIGNFSDDIKDMLAINNTEGVASIEGDEKERFWEVAKEIKPQTGESFLVKMKLSLKEVDEAFERGIRRVYLVTFFSSLILILLMINHFRLSRYVILFNKMKEVDQMKDEFISLVSHELKTPLTAIRGYADLLKEELGNSLESKQKEYLKNIEISTERLRDLVEDILEVSRIEQSRLKLEISQVDPNEAVSKVIDFLTPQAQKKKLKIGVKNELKADSRIEIDPKRLEQILINLVSNAIKYTPQGKVQVRIFEENEKVFISVEDTGLGMSAKEQKSLFQKFYRIRNKETSGISGTGLGLWITKSLTEKMGGEIEVESMKGVGSKFIVSFKKAESGKG